MALEAAWLPMPHNRGRDARVVCPLTHTIQMLARQSSKRWTCSSASDRSVASSSIISACAASDNSECAGGRCFLPQALLRTLTGQFVAVKDLVENAIVESACGNPVRVAFIHHHGKADVVELRTSAARLTVSACHRVLVPDPVSSLDDPRHKSVMVSSLQVGDQILCKGGMEGLVSITPQVVPAAVIEVVFVPDLPLEAFDPVHPTILCKGAAMQNRAGQQQTRRGGMGRRGRSWKATSQRPVQEQESGTIPNTEDGFED